MTILLFIILLITKPTVVYPRHKDNFFSQSCKKLRESTIFQHSIDSTIPFTFSNVLRLLSQRVHVHARLTHVYLSPIAPHRLPGKFLPIGPRQLEACDFPRSVNDRSIVISRWQSRMFLLLSVFTTFQPLFRKIQAIAVEILPTNLSESISYVAREGVGIIQDWKWIVQFGEMSVDSEKESRKLSRGWTIGSGWFGGNGATYRGRGTWIERQERYPNVAIFPKMKDTRGLSERRVNIYERERRVNLAKHDPSTQRFAPLRVFFEWHEARIMAWSQNG